MTKILNKGIYQLPGNCKCIIKPNNIIEIREKENNRLTGDEPRCKNCKYCVLGHWRENQWWTLYVCLKKPKKEGENHLFKATNLYNGKDCEMFEKK